MAQVLKEEIEKKIYQSAIDEFYIKGYQSATLRDIAKGAGIPVGLIYTYYANKEALFDAVVGPTYLSLKKMLAKKTDSADNHSMHSKLLQEELPFILNLLKNNRKPFIILVDKSNGTAYKNAREELIQLTQIHIRAQLHDKITHHGGKTVDDLFYHILANNFTEGLFEIARHYKDEEWATHMMQLLMQQYLYGLSSLVT